MTTPVNFPTLPRLDLVHPRDHRAGAAGARSRHVTGGPARLVDCGYCHAGPWEPCLTGRNGSVGDHLARFARAESRGLMGTADLDAVLAAAGDGMFSGATVIPDRPALERRPPQA